MYLLLLVLCLIGIYVISQQKSKTLTYALGMFAIILLVCANTYDHIEAFTNLGHAPRNNYKMGPLDGINVEEKYNINNQQMSTYDGLKLSLKESNKKHELLPSVNITSPVGEDIMLKQDPSSYSFPTVDGDPNSPKKMFMFAHNKSSLACCPSTYSDDRGCICTTEQQRNMIMGRGGNKKSGSYHDF
jgi:hypothetical protein